MELKIESGTISLTTEDTAEGLADALIALVKRFGQASGSVAPSGDVLFLGLDVDVRTNNGLVQLGVSNRLGWTHKALEHAQVRHLIKVLQATLSEAESGGTHVIQ